MARRRRNKKNNAPIYLFIIFAFLGLLAGLGYLFYLQTSNKNITLDDRLCPINHEIQGHYVILIDQTDPFTDIQQQDFALKMQKKLESIPQYTLVSVYTINSNYKEHQKPLIELCNPGNGEDLNEMTSNVNKVKKRYKELFLQPIQGLVAEIDTKIEDKNSPIMETMQLVNLNSFAKDSNQMNKKLIIVSDLIQNTSLINMYQMNKLNFKEFKKKFDYQKTKTNLQDSTVEVLFLSRRPKIQTQQLIDFWEQYFLDNNASLISLERLEG